MQQIAERFNGTLAALEKTVSSPEFAEGVGAIGPSINEARKAIQMLSHDLQPLLVEINTKMRGLDAEKLFARLDNTLKSIDGAAANIGALSSKGYPLATNADRTLVEISAAARELRQLAEMLQRRPEVLLTGKR